MVFCTANRSNADEPKQPATAAKVAESIESKYLSNIRQVTRGMVKAGEGYFSPDGKHDHLSGRAAGLSVLSDLHAAARRGERTAARQHRPRAHDVQLFLPTGKRILFASAISIHSCRKPRSRHASSKRKTSASRHAPALPVGLRSVHGHLRGRSRRQEPAAADRTPGYDAEGAYSPRRQADRLLQRPRRRPRHLRDERRRQRPAAAHQRSRATTAGRSSRPTASGSSSAATARRKASCRSTRSASTARTTRR